MQFARTKPTAEIALQPTPVILVEAAVASVKPSTLSRKEAAVSDLRDRRSEISAKLAKHLEAARERGGGLPSTPTEPMVAAQKTLDACDVELRTARADLVRARQEFAPEFNRVVDEFRREAGNKLIEALSLIVEAHAVLAAVEHRALCSGIETSMHSHSLRGAAGIIEPVARSYGQR
jgi:hypothetical protein